MIICACTINAAARAVYRFKHTQVYVIASICMHACMQGTRSCKCARYVMLTERGRSDPRPGARACIAKAISICTYIYIYIYRNIYVSVHACTIEREREMHARRACVNAWIDACMRAHAHMPARLDRLHMHVATHKITYSI